MNKRTRNPEKLSWASSLFQQGCLDSQTRGPSDTLVMLGDLAARMLQAGGRGSGDTEGDFLDYAPSYPMAVVLSILRSQCLLYIYFFTIVNWATIHILYSHLKYSVQWFLVY